jgi:hypothetical protein
MLAADKAALESDLRKRAIEIQDKELTYFVNNFNSVASQSALLAGFSFSALTLTNFKGIQGENKGYKVAFYTATCLSMSFQLIAVLMATFVSSQYRLLQGHVTNKFPRCSGLQSNMWGPGLALRGPPGSMKTVRPHHFTILQVLV